MSRAEWGAVWPIIAVRAVQVGAVAAVVLAGLWFLVPVRVLVWLSLLGGVLVTMGLSAYFLKVFDPRSTFGYPLVVRIEAPIPTPLPLGERPRGGCSVSPVRRAGEGIALTFDDGPHPETTPELLEVLARFGAKATFFLVAEAAKAYPELTRRIAAEGHTVGVHGLRHRAMVLQSGRSIAADLAAAENAFGEVLGRPLPCRLLRPPHGFKTWTLCRVAHRQGWTLIGWSRDGRDYDDLSADEIAKTVLDGLSAGDIVLLHERPGKRETLDALPHILEGIQAHGLVCVPLAPI